MGGIFDILYEWMAGSFLLAMVASFGWGVLSILLSPCHLSGIPLIVGYISSQEKISVNGSFKISFVFSIGILITIALTGIITASLGRLMGDIGTTGNYIVASIFFLMGLYLLDIFNFTPNTFGLTDTKFKGIRAVLILGFLFGIALGPCTFAFMAPVLGIVLQTAQTNLILAILFLLAFALGHCLVIVLAGVMAGKVQKYLTWNSKKNAIIHIRRICGILVILGGFYLIYIT